MNIENFFRRLHRIELLDNEVHVWSASLRVPLTAIDFFWKILATDERYKANRFYFERDRIRFIAGRGLLRMILGSYLNTNPASLEFAYNRYGKPALTGINGNETLQFNMSHSVDRAMYAVTWNRAVGIDIEHLRHMPDSDQIIERYCSEKEKTDFRTLSESLKTEGFFTCWTRKEAYIKATGEGLTRPLDEFSVTLVPGQPAELSGCCTSATETDRWLLKEIPPGAPGYVAALAVQGNDWKLSRYYSWQWESENVDRIAHQVTTLR